MNEFRDILLSDDDLYLNDVLVMMMLKLSYSVSIWSILRSSPGICSTLISSSPILNKYYDHQILTNVMTNQNINTFRFGFDFWTEKIKSQ